jgi:hypothetical protein
MRGCYTISTLITHHNNQHDNFMEKTAGVSSEAVPMLWGDDICITYNTCTVELSLNGKWAWSKTTN